MSENLTPQQRAGQTLKTRNFFKILYGEHTALVVRAIAEGRSTSDIAEAEGITKSSIAAFRANVTRGTYHPFVVAAPDGQTVGTCNF